MFNVQFILLPRATLHFVVDDFFKAQRFGKPENQNILFSSNMMLFKPFQHLIICFIKLQGFKLPFTQ